MKQKIKELKKLLGLAQFNRDFYKLKSELQKHKAEYSPEIIINIMYQNEFKNETALF